MSAGKVNVKREEQRQLNHDSKLEEPTRLRDFRTIDIKFK